MSGLAGVRLLVVGASSGIGRAVAERAILEGARVAALARRAEGAVTATCDVRDAASVAAAVAAAIEGLGGLDAVVYAAGVAPLAPLAEADASVWREAFDVNVTGAALVARAALPGLAATAGRGLFLSSDGVGSPRAGLAIYTASKAALEELVVGLRREHPEVRWTTMVVGPTATDIASRWDRKLAGRLWKQWQAEGYDQKPAAPVDVVARRILDVLENEGDVPRVSTHES